MCTYNSVASHIYEKYWRGEEYSKITRAIVTFSDGFFLSHQTQLGPLAFLFHSSLYLLYHNHFSIVWGICLLAT